MTEANTSQKSSHHKSHFSDTSTQTAKSKDTTTSTSSQDAQPAPWRALFAFKTRRNIPLLIAATFCSLVAGAAQPAQSLLIGRIFQGFTDYATGRLNNDEFMKQQTKYVVFFTALAAASWLFHSLDFMFWLAFGELQAKSARDRLFHGLLGKKVEWYDRRKNGIGALLPRLQAQIRELQLATAQPMGTLIVSLSTAVLSLVQAFVHSWDLTLVTLATVPVVLALVMWVGKPMQTNLAKQTEKLEEAQKYSTNALGVIETVKCFNGQDVEVEKYTTTINAAAVSYAWVANASALQMGLVVLLSVSMFVQGFYYGGVLVADGKINSGDVITTFFSAIGAFQAIQGILPQMIVFEKGRSAGATLRAVMAEMESKGGKKEEDGGRKLKPEGCKGHIDVKDLSFAYPSRPDVSAVRDITLFIQGGEMTFLIGKSGSGKSTIPQLLMGFYACSEGSINIDGVPLADLDTEWLRSNITLVEQTSLLFNDTVFRNIAFGRKDYENVTREDVTAASEFALLQLMISDMPNGLDTIVGFKGGSMSGGQRQRMALARARLRDTPILILDESTSALDHISRTLMMEAIRRWRKGKTTIIITHDISQIQPEDFLYLLEGGRVVQEGYRKHLERMKGTAFHGFLSEEQRAGVELFEEKRKSGNGSLGDADTPTTTTSSEYELDPLERALTLTEKRKTQRQSYFPNVLMEGSPLIGMRAYNKGPTSAFASPWMRMAATAEGGSISPRKHHPVDASTPSSAAKSESPTSSKRWSKLLENLVDQTGKFAAEARSRTPKRRAVMRRDSDGIPFTGPEESLAVLEANAKKPEKEVRLNSFKAIFSTLWPSLDWLGKLYLLLGIWGASVHAVGSPVFSFILSKLLATYSIPGGDKQKSLMYSMAILGIAFADASHTWAFRFFHEYTSQLWVDYIRGDAYEHILDQPRDFFEKEENSVSRLTESLDRNAEEMRNLLGRFASLAYVAVLMVLVSIVWSLASQWKMTLIALAVSPYIFAVTKAFAKISEKWESHSNDAAEAASAIFTETFTNIKTVRALTLEGHFLNKYIKATNYALRVGFQRSFYAGFFYGLSDSAGEFATAMIFYVGSKLVVGGAKVNDIITVFSMLIFTITNVSAILGFIPQIGSAKDTAGRLLALANMPTNSHEHLGDTRIVTVGDILFEDFRFAYPSRPEQTVLKNINLRLRPGTATAIVGGSGSGKSTIANLLLDLYSTSSLPGSRISDLTFGGRPITHIYTPSLRALIVPVSQTPTLFAATVTENIAYGLPADSPHRAPDSISHAALQAGIHAFITSLPHGYATPIGDGGLGLSGGQAQRIAIARALVRQPAVLVLDEATSALDVESANLIRETIKSLICDGEVGRKMTVVIITHHRDMMEIAERVVVLEQGRVVEEGGFGELVGRNGALGNLLSGGEWDGGEGGVNGAGAGAGAREVEKRGGVVPVLKDVDWRRGEGGRGGKGKGKG
ncbi:hypothetical protein M409DRAFT_29408 [Zasmidium cellare ATCC 36951]|uniref:ABC transporter n=1 Tax=Zasmidium cellare ATCC 36951 TaxID=1080233 RepID=A0A6A6BZA1_ZASCE|nr:uncharacterized protein M409DRAFT_29408 [Zasmidium cellare ATCC 36951]KAF2160111.1 hypothetical protein M409DRAFT_29408 [Zasmidium cellare ATCC 36951]